MMQDEDLRLLTSELRNTMQDIESSLDTTSEDMQELQRRIYTVAYNYRVADKLPAVDYDNLYEHLKDDIDSFSNAFYDELVRLNLYDALVNITEDILDPDFDWDESVDWKMSFIEKAIDSNNTAMLDWVKQIRTLLRTKIDHQDLGMCSTIWRIQDIINLVGKHYRVGESKKRLKNFISVIEQLMKVLLPINVDSLNVDDDNTQFDYMIKKANYLTTTKVHTYKGMVYSSILKMLCSIGEYDIFEKYMKRYSLYVSNDSRDTLIRNIHANYFNGEEHYHKERLANSSTKTIYLIEDMLNNWKKKYSPSNVVAVAKGMFDKIAVIIGINKPNIVNSSANAGEKFFMDKINSLILSMRDDFEKDKRTLGSYVNCSIRDVKTSEAWNFMNAYYSKYIYPISDSYRFFPLDEEQRANLAALRRELESIHADCNVDSSYNGDVYKSVYSGIEDFESELNSIFEKNLDDDIAKIKDTEFGQDALNHKEEHIKEFLSGGIDIYSLKNNAEKFNINDVNRAYDAIKSNVKLTDNLAIAEANYQLFRKIFADGTSAGDYTFAVVVFIKSVERYMKEVLAQHYPDDIHKTSRQGRHDEGRLVIPLSVAHCIDADYLSHEQSGVGYDNGSRFNGLECGVAYYALKYTVTTVIKANLTKEYELADEECTKMDFNSELVQKVRNGYLHIDNIANMSAAEDNRCKTAFWFLHLTKCLPKLVR